MGEGQGKGEGEEWGKTKKRIYKREEERGETDDDTREIGDK